MAWRAAVGIAYDGRDFMGSQRQPGLPTVEGEVIRALRSIRAIRSPDGARFATASRTDRGVSALGNVVAFDTDFQGEELLRALNAASEGVHFHALAEVSDDFNPRRAVARRYRYLLPSAGRDPERLARAAEVFRGEHDFRHFCRSDGRDTVKELKEVRVLPLGRMVALEFEGREFLWNMVRRIVAAVDQAGSGRVDLKRLERALEGGDDSLGLAPPENLFLMEVRYDFPLEARCTPTLSRKVEEGMTRTMLEMQLYGALEDLCPGRGI
ncbi:MAG: tRNA pseudouridine(38-40) synthase TruA [Methanomassiliicoccales archaeon]